MGHKRGIDGMQAAPAFSHLTITGGAIGCGPPLAVGAAIAQPHSTVINIQVRSRAAPCSSFRCVGEEFAAYTQALLSLQLCGMVTAAGAQADGSALYSVQALWTQAREQLHVVTVICANRTYAILKVRTESCACL